MYIILQNDLNDETIINIIHGYNISIVDEWIKKYLKNNYSDNYFIEYKDDIYYLMENTKVNKKGYLYNTTNEISKKILSVRIIEFDNNSTDVLYNTSTNLLEDIDIEIIKRIMKIVDHESLFQMNMKFLTEIKTKKMWSTFELILLQNEITNNFKKKLYSSIAKKTKKFETHSFLAKNNLLLKQKEWQQSLLQLPAIPENHEYILVKQKVKQE